MQGLMNAYTDLWAFLADTDNIYLQLLDTEPHTLARCLREGGG